jgi:phosphoribosyl 1,2-cyclic phosphodiesterase
VTFWGVRGCIPTPDEENARYGGNTLCVGVQGPEGTLVALDAGMGLRWMSDSLPPGPVELHLLLTHCHWDHIQGIPFSPCMYSPGNRVHIYGRRPSAAGLKETLLRLMDPAYCPVPNFFLLKKVGADVEFHEIEEPDFQVGGIRVKSLPLPRGRRGSPSSGYRLECRGKVLAYLSDVEYPPGETGEPACPQALELARGADLLIHDASCLPEESGCPGGHSNYRQAAALARQAQVRRLALYHHAPGRTDEQLDELARRCQALSPPTFVAREGLELEL